LADLTVSVKKQIKKNDLLKKMVKIGRKQKKGEMDAEKWFKTVLTCRKMVSMGANKLLLRRRIEIYVIDRGLLTRNIIFFDFFESFLLFLLRFFVAFLRKIVFKILPVSTDQITIVSGRLLFSIR